MMGNVNKTDTLDARVPAILRRNGTLPAVSIAPYSLRIALVKEPKETERIRCSAKVTIIGMDAAIKAVHPSVTQ